jgi:hypothetical protein
MTLLNDTNISNTQKSSMASQQRLKDFYIGQDVAGVPKPALVLDAAIIRRHCETMIRTVRELDVGFRAHFKSHKVSPVIYTTLYKALINQDVRNCRNANWGQGP